MATRHTSKRTLRNFQSSFFFLTGTRCWNRSRTEGTWNDKFPEDSITFLNRLKGAAEETWGHRDALSIVMVSHIEHSSKNLDNLLRICNQYRQIADEGLITSIFITRERCESLEGGYIQKPHSRITKFLAFWQTMITK